ncbi:FtsK/SpoIIIE domain-containing protein [Sphaerisporangium sp. TRM90804]|uniref:FtsK/SpoIIIE domain-containing protein n=1 Tax=Sphaerisporangium sp. TRM90804 TaxID=3031113 RepID=UPI00244A3569|nr:FtsK/SpoIIIE domain-containing protein [Sphaerisporangium sp. TRM90804]MDH2426416.1 FtsK/SpoIIIE domain-containing protein [Sphaerisporangium sp. TRM90804]
MEYEVTIVDQGGTATPLLISAGESATVRGLVEAIGRTPDARLYLESEWLRPDQPLSATSLRTGARLAFAPSSTPAAVPASRWEAAVVGGPAAGTAVPLGDDAAVLVGRAPGAGLVLDDPEVSRRHAELRLGADGTVVVADAGSRNGVGWRGHRIGADTPVPAGDLVRIGESMVTVRPAASGDAELDQAGGVRRFNRPPRIAPPRRRPEVAVPSAPDQPKGIRFPLATVLLPLVLGGVVYALMPSSAMFLIFLALSPLMAVAHVITERRSGRGEYKEKLRAYESEMDTVRARLGAIAVAQEKAAREALPDPAAVTRIATGPSGRLFERRPDNDDFGRLRVGLADRPADVRLTGQGADAEEPPTVYAVPVALDLVAAGVAGVAGPRAAILPIARALVAQAATLHAPHDLGLVIFSGEDTAPDWEWATWLPHTLPHRPDLACRRMVATDRELAETRIAELLRIMEERRSGLRSGVSQGRRLLLVLDGVRRARSLTGLADLLAEGPGVGIYAVCLDRSESDLPDECRTTVVADSSGGRARVSGADVPDEEVLTDHLPQELADKISGSLAPIRVLGARFSEDGDLPERVRYLDLARLGARPHRDEVLARWAAQPSGRGTTALIGVDGTGPVAVDLRRDGPHTLIAGTSGAGKSELLQTLVASLALGNEPDALNLVLVDYKGGSAFAECRDLPHCVGMITDLDGRLTDRALASLTAELRRRETILAEAGAKDIEDYWARTGGRLPRLVIVIDEFATLVEELPDFITGVVGIGMRGRSLGVHLVLATQRPGGVVNADLRANVNLRLCLRVTRPDESTDVIDVSDAASISRLHPGRAYLRTGHGDLSTLQCARVGWPRDDAPDARARADVVTVARRRITELGRARLVDGLAGPDEGHAGDTDLTALVAAIREAAEHSGVSAPPSPWLPPLPDRLTIPLAEDGGAPPPIAHIGLADLPASQAQSPFLLDLELAAPTVIAGMARSGRSTALRTLAASLAAAGSPADLHLYVLDHGNRALTSLEALPHCGAYVEATETDRTTRLLDLLTSQMTERAQILAANGHASLREQRATAAPSDRLPYLVLLIDQYESFLAQHAETDGGRLVETLDGLLRRGAAVGILIVLTTDRSGFTHRLAGTAATRLVLRQADRDDAAVFGADPRAMSATPPGRAMAIPAGMEVQIALLTPDPDGAAQAAAVEDLAKRLADRWERLPATARPHRIDRLPVSIDLAALEELRGTRVTSTPSTCTVGAGGDHLRPIDVDLVDTDSVFLVSGPPRSGRSAALAAIVSSLHGRENGELSVLLCCPRRSPLMELADLPGVVAALHGSAIATDLEETIARTRRPLAVVVDDAERLSEGLAADVLDRLVHTARDDGNLVIAAGTTDDLATFRYRNWIASLRRARSGLLLNPTSYVDGEVFEVKLPRSTGGGQIAGRALLIRRGQSTSVQVPRVAPR